MLYIHYSGKDWRNNEDTYKTLNEFSKLFTYKILIVFYEIISVFLTPYILYKMSKQSKKIIYFFTNIITYDEDIGYHCSYASEQYFNNNELVKSSKFEKSLLNFKYHYNEKNDDISTLGKSMLRLDSESL